MSKKSYDLIDQEVRALWRGNRKEEAISLLESCIAEYPEKNFEINQGLSFMYKNIGNIQKTVEILNSQLDKGIFYPKLYFKDLWEKEEFKEIRGKWEEVYSKAQKENREKCIIRTPKNYDSKKAYPLFIALHGWGEDVDMFGSFWKSNKLEEDYIVLIPQASEIISSNGYAWNDEECSRKEIKEACIKVLNEYPIDSEKIVVGGFSQGAMMSVDIAIVDDELSVKGFIALNPDKPESFTDENISKAASKGIKGFIITGDKDGCYDEQKEMMETFHKLNFKCDISVKENFGHWFPDDLGENIDSALEYILE